jgi:septal ring factor EnvC (AmiA/AmiB activator)
MAKIDTIDNEVKGLKVLLNDRKLENSQLKIEAKENEKKLQDMNERNNQLENRLNNLEQHHRGWSARALNIPLTQARRRKLTTMLWLRKSTPCCSSPSYVVLLKENSYQK